MKKWRVDYAFRKDGTYTEAEMFVIATSIYSVISEANAVLNKKAWDEKWDTVDRGPYRIRYEIWNVGLMADADEEVI